MKFRDEDIKVFCNDIFVDGYCLYLEDNDAVSRDEMVLNLVKGKSVLHVGCCDHLEVMDEKIANHQWFHGLLDEQAKYLAGVDINAAAVQHIYDKKYADNIFCCDITASVPTELASVHFDYILLGEVLEHVDNPVSFLQCIRKNVGDHADRIIITVPSALRFRRRWEKRGKKGDILLEESNNSLHRYWFTPFTLAKVMGCAGITPEELFFADMSGTGVVMDIKRKLFGKGENYYSTTANTLVCVGKL